MKNKGYGSSACFALTVTDLLTCNLLKQECTCFVYIPGKDRGMSIFTMYVPAKTNSITLNIYCMLLHLYFTEMANTCIFSLCSIVRSLTLSIICNMIFLSIN